MMKLLVVVSILIAGVSARAQQMFESARSIRSLGMGGVYIPIVTGADSLFYNPAALGKSKELNFLLADIAAQTNTDTVKELPNISKIDPNNPSTFSSFYGETLEALVSGKTAFSAPNFGFGYSTNYTATMQLHNPAYPQFNTYFVNDQAYILGGAFSVGPSSYLGINLKQLRRWGGYTQELTVSQVSGGMTVDQIGHLFDNKGVGYGVDLGFITELPTPFKPTLAVVWQDVGNTAFTMTSGTDAPPHIPQNLSVGASVGFDLPGIDWTAGIEARHLLEPEFQNGKKIHLGTELSLPMIDLRAGLSQGYLSYGAGVNFLIFRLDAVSYTEELGVYPGQSADNRYAVSLTFDLSFDADFHFTDNAGKKRKLKQRR